MTSLSRTRTALAAAAAAALLTLTACGGGDDSGSGSSGEESSGQSSEDSQAGQDGQDGGPQPDLEGIPDVVAEVNGEEVTREEFVQTYEAQFQQASMQAQMGGGEAPDEEQLKKQTADGLVDTELLRQEAEERGIEVSDADVDTKLDELAQQNQLGTGEDFLKALEEQGTSEEQAREQLQTQVLIEGLVDDEAGGIEASEKDLRALYAQVKQQQAQAGQQGQKVPPYKQVKPQLEQQAVSEEQSRVAQGLLDGLREDADIQINL